jgi:hypothetical protein
MTDLERLNLRGSTFSGGNDVRQLTTLRQLTALNLDKQAAVQDDTLRRLTGLTALSLCDNHCITDHGLAPLTRLTTLNVQRAPYITSWSLVRLCALRHLSFDGDDSDEIIRTTNKPADTTRDNMPYLMSARVEEFKAQQEPDARVHWPGHTYHPKDDL